ncbi:MAG: hypothetical protein GX628_11020 [Clostridiales bacterium]|nr:hypothetical protein [Clostridiales bacterium]
MIKTNTSLRLFTLLLASVMLAAFVSCSGGGDKGADTGSAAAQATEAPETEITETGRAAIRDGLPDDADLGGRTIRLLCRNGDQSTAMEFCIEEESGDVVEDAVYLRNMKVCERLNCGIETKPVAEDRHGGSKINALVTSVILAGDDEYDMLANHMNQSNNHVLQGPYLNLANLDWLDFSQPWWCSSYTKAVTIDGKQYTCTGEASISMISSAYIIFVNKAVYGEHFDGSVYDIVLDGEWTLDKISELSAAVYSDLNGNGVKDYDDLVGLVYHTAGAAIEFDGLSASCRLTFTEEKDGKFFWALENPRTADFLDKAKRMLHDGNNAFGFPGEFDGAMLGKCINDTALFTFNYLIGTSHLRDMESDYGILPMPKLYESDDGYSSSVHNGASVFAIPVTAKNPDEIAMFMEAANAESYRSVTPAYFDVALKVKYARDDEASQMLDIAVGGLYFDRAYTFNTLLDSPATVFRTMLQTTAAIDSGMSTIASYKSKFDTNLAKLTDGFAALN